MNLLFIDANIYLGLFNTNKPEFKKLLNSLIELKNNIFISKQIVDEVSRNKLNVFRQSIDNYIRQSTVISTMLPEHLDNERSKSFSDWNKKRKNLELMFKDSNQDLHFILDNVLNSISESSDNISKLLEEIFSAARPAQVNELINARIRRELGNPPGKSDDPLGDQLSWEMLINSLDNISTLYIVSTDRDYFTEHKDSLYLNPLLSRDVLKANGKIKIKLFNKLSEALRDYNKETQIHSLPDNDELNKISEIESIGLQPGLNISISNRPTACPNCNSKDSFTGGSYLRSDYGKLTLQYVCNNCNYRFDSGEAFD